MAKKRRSGLRGTPSEHLEYAAWLLKREKAALRLASCSQMPELMLSAGSIMSEARNSGNAKLLALGAKHRDAVRAKLASCLRR